MTETEDVTTDAVVPAPEPKKKHWVLDFNVPVAVVGAVVLQTFGIGWYCSNLNSRIVALEVSDVDQKAFVAARVKLAEERWLTIVSDRERVAKIETSMQFIVDGIRRIEQKMDKRDQ